MKYLIVIALTLVVCLVVVACTGPMFSLEEADQIRKDWQDRNEAGDLTDAELAKLLSALNAAQEPGGFSFSALAQGGWSLLLSLLYAKTGLDLRKRGPAKPMTAEKVAALERLALRELET